jgi:protein-S-isoprenylcysteine O-methyltransferase
MPHELRGWIETVWTLVGIYWLVAALRSKPAVRRERWLSRLGHLCLMALALSLLFCHSTGIAVLETRLLPESTWIAWAGFVITIAGCAIAVWARALLGSNWSATVTLKQNHELVRRGPYAIVRHPVYSGLLLGMMGTALALGEGRGFVACALAFAAWLTKARTEEKFLAEQFGEAYACYRRQVKQLIPFVL